MTNATISHYNVAQYTEDRTPIAVGYLAYNGARLTCKAHIDQYNALSAEVYRWEDSGRGVPKHILNERHRHFAIMCEVALESQKLAPIVARLNVAAQYSRGPVFSVFSTTAHGNWNRHYLGGSAHNAAQEARKLVAEGACGVSIRCDGVDVDWAGARHSGN